jgi:hypothetical protein
MAVAEEVTVVGTDGAASGLFFPDADIIGKDSIHLSAFCCANKITEFLPVISRVNDKTLVSLYFTAAVLTGVETVVDGQRTRSLAAGKRLASISHRADFRRCKKTVVDGGLALAVNEADQSAVAVTQRPSENAVKAAVLQVDVASGHVSDKTAVVGITANGGVDEDGRLTVFNIVVIAFNPAYQTGREFPVN